MAYSLSKKVIYKARTTYYLSLIEENKNNTSQAQLCWASIPLSLSSNYFMNILTSEILTIREQINQTLSATGMDGICPAVPALFLEEFFNNQQNHLLVS